MSLSQLVCESGKATVVSNAVSEQVLYSKAVLAAICRVSNIGPGFDKDKKKIRIFITRAKRRRYLYFSVYLNPFWYRATPNHRPGFRNLRQAIK